MSGECGSVLHARLVAMVGHTRQMQQQSEARLALDQGANRGTAEAHDEIPLPMAWHGAISCLRGTFADHYLGRDEGFSSAAGARSRYSQRPPGTQAGRQLAAQSATTLNKQRLINRFVADAHGLIELRGLLAEFGIIANKGMSGINELLTIVADPDDTRIAGPLRAGLVAIAATLRALDTQLEKVDQAMLSLGRADKTCRHLNIIPGFGSILSTAMAARVTSPQGFDSGRHFAASLGIVPRQDGTGGKVKLGPISKRGDGYLRRLLVNGAMSVLRSKRAKQDPWLVKLLASKPLKVVAVALANKMARIGWSVMMRQEDFRVEPVAAA